MNRIVELVGKGYGLATRVGDALSWLPPTVARLTVGKAFYRSP